jgi:hypothetical protein
MKRKLKRKGVPKHLAKELSKKYQGILKQYTSIRGLWRVSKKFRKKSDPEMEDDDLSTISYTQAKNYSISF